MSPTSSSSAVYDRLMINAHQPPKMLPRSHSKSECDGLQMMSKRKSHSNDEHERSKRRLTITHISAPETVIHCSISNQAYDRPLIRKSSTNQHLSTWRPTEPTTYRIPTSCSSVEIRSMDFRPLITSGRRKLGPIPTSASMIIVKKKSPPSISSLSFQQKRLTRSIPVDILSNNASTMVASIRPSSLSYSCSSSSYSSLSSASASSSNAGTIFLPIQITRSQNNNNNNNRQGKNIQPTNGIAQADENEKGYRYVQKPVAQQIPIVFRKTANVKQALATLSDDEDYDQSKEIPSSSTPAGEGNDEESADMTDSQVLRLIRRYDPVGSPTLGIKSRPSLEHTRGVWQTVAPKITSSPLLLRRSLTTALEDESPIRATSTPRLQRQQAIQEHELAPVSPLRPILKYASPRPRAELTLQPHKTEPLRIDIEPFVPPPSNLSNESPAGYQPLITTGTKRVCAALSKSDWDLRLQQDLPPQVPPLPFPVRPPSPPLEETEPSRSSLIRSQSSQGIDNSSQPNEQEDDFDEMSAPIPGSGSCVQRLKQLLSRKSSLDLSNSTADESHRSNPADSDFNKRLPSQPTDPSATAPRTAPVLPPPRAIINNHRSTIIQEVTPVSSPSRKPAFRSEKTIDCPESVSRPSTSTIMPSSELSSDAYRFHRSTEHDTLTARPRNVAKVEPYLFNANVARPLNPSSAGNPTNTAAAAVSAKARIVLNSMGNTSSNSSSSAASLAGMHRQLNVFQSDFLVPNPAHLIPLPPAPQSFSNSSSSYTTPPMLLSESLMHASLHQLPAVENSLYNEQPTSLALSSNHAQQKHRSLTQADLPARIPISSSYHNPNSNSNPYAPAASYHYRPSSASTTAMPNSVAHQRQAWEVPQRSVISERPEDLLDAGQQQQQQPSRRRFQKRKQMKRSKSVDLYQEPSAYLIPSVPAPINAAHRHPKSISREFLTGGGAAAGLVSPSASSSSSSSSMEALEHVNQAALLRYKSLDSMTFNHRALNHTGRENHRRAMSKPMEYDFDSDDSVCGIPKPRKLCTSSKNANTADRTILESSLAEKDQRDSARTVSLHPAGTSTGLTNSVRQNETPNDQTYALVEPTPSVQPMASKPLGPTTHGMKEGEASMQRQPPAGISLAETQFYARTSNLPDAKPRDLPDRKSDEVYSSPPADDTFHDAIDDLSMPKDPIGLDKVKPAKVSPTAPLKQSVPMLDASEFSPISSSSMQTVRPLSSTILINPFERLRPLDMHHEPRSSEESSLQIFDRSFVSAKRDPFVDDYSSSRIPAIRPLEKAIEPTLDQFDDQNDSSTSTTTTSRSIHLPVEKQRGLSEIIRKRNSRCKVEDYKRSYQKPTAVEEDEQNHRTLPTSKSDPELVLRASQIPALIESPSIELPTEIPFNNDKRAQKSIERLNVLLSTDETSEQAEVSNAIDEKMSVADKKNLFETFSKDLPFGGTLPRSKSAKLDDSSVAPPMTKKYAGGNQRSKTENILPSEPPVEVSPESNVFDDDTSKLTFKEKMILFNKKNAHGLTPSPSLKHNRNRLTQPVTAEEVQAAANMTPTSSSQQINKLPVHAHIRTFSLHSSSARPILKEKRLNHPHVRYISTFIEAIDEATLSNPEDSENRLPVSQRLQQFKAYGDTDWKQQSKVSQDPSASQSEKNSSNVIQEQKPLASSTRKTPTMKYHAKKTNTDQEQRAKTVDIVRLKAEPIAKSKDTDQIGVTNGNRNGTAGTKSTQKTVSVLKSDTVTVLKTDDCLDEFFAPASKNIVTEPAFQLNTDDLNRIAENTVRLQSQAPRVKPPRRQQQGAKNPLRQIQATIPTEDQYTEVHTNLSEQEVRRLKRAQIAETAGVAQEALAALTSAENFAEINLRKVDRSMVATFGYEPYKDIMLILVKGHRQCSLQLLEPTYLSINEGDCYLLITPLKVFGWLGRYANSAEKSRVFELIDYLKQHRDLGLRNETKFFILDQAKDDTENDIHAEFRDVLRGDLDGHRSVDEVTDDDFYEMNRIESNRVYRVEDDLLLPLDEFCFRPLSVKILDGNQVFIFDFGSELYVWNGKYADKAKRQMGLQLAQQLWNDTYDFSDCAVNPFDPLDDENELTSQVGAQRPAWCLFGKLNQNVETVLFKGKFADWSSDLNEPKATNDTNQNGNKLATSQRPVSIVEALKPADVHQMLAEQDTSVNLVLEQISLGRGKHWYDPVEKRGHNIQTISIDIWHVTESDRDELPKSSYGQFHSDDVYIIRWRYKLQPLALGQTSVPKPDIGRDRVAYWIWQGINASPNERGISALMAVCVNEEKGPHIHVLQEHEEAAFLQLFDGTFTIHQGKRNQPKAKKSPWHLYVFLGEIDAETHWWELNVHSVNLRSRTSFLFIHQLENLMLLWHGCGTTDQQKMLAGRSAMKLRDKCPKEFHFNGDSETMEFHEMQEGDETELFWQAINERHHERKYHSLLNVRTNPKPSSTMRIFHLSSLHGPFVAQELLYPLRSSDHISPFPFTQSDLYELHQPALCLIDAHSELYIWQGWNDLSDDELGVQLSNANLLAAGPRDIRFTTERRCALRTAIDYYREKTGSSTLDVPCSIVYAGLETVDFINLFPKWSVHSKARQQNQLEGKCVNQKDSVIDVLNQLCRERYSIDELRARPLPEGVDPSRIESYLSNDDFQREFRMTKEEFYALPFWKQTNLKKPLGFF